MTNGFTNELLKARDMAALLGVNERTIWRWAGCGVIPPPLRIGQVKGDPTRGSPKRSCAARWRRCDLDVFLSSKVEEAAREAASLAKLG